MYGGVLREADRKQGMVEWAILQYQGGMKSKDLCSQADRTRRRLRILQVVCGDDGRTIAALPVAIYTILEMHHSHKDSESVTLHHDEGQT
jgi:hypothetical protein